MIDRGRILLSLAASALSLAAAEGAFRLLEARLGVDRARLERFREFVRTGGETAQYEPRPHVLYVRRPSLPEINSLGFIGAEFPKEKRPGVPRIVCLGSSTTEGGNPLGEKGSFPHFLAEILGQGMGRPVEVLNFGMSGWTTAETLVNYFLVVQDFAPDVVIIHEAVNDVEPRAWPGFRPDYSHYRRPWREIRYSLPFRLLTSASDFFAAFQLRRHEGELGLPAVVVRPPGGPYAFEGGRLPPDTAAAFLRNVRTIAEHARLHGARPVLVTVPYDPVRARTMGIYRVGIDDHNRILRELAREAGFALVDLDAEARAQPEGLHAAFLDLVHLTPEGNRFKARAIARTLSAEGLP